MAIKTTKPAGAKRKHKKSVSPFRNEKFRFIAGIFILLASAYLLVSFISFIFYGAADQSKLDLPWSRLILESDIHVNNHAGKTGAWLAEVIINRGFGFASFIFIYLLFVTGFKIMKINLTKYKRTLIYSILAIIWISITTGFIFPKTDAASFIYPGGRYGFIISSWLSSLIGKTGLSLLLFLSLLSLIVFRFESAFTYLSGLFKRSDKHRPAEVNTAEASAEKPLVTDNTISKVIEEDDVVQAIFASDNDISEELEIENLLGTKEEN